MRDERKKDRDLRNSAGLTLLELLLVVGIGGVAMVGFTQMSNEWRENSRNELVAKHLATVQNAAENYVSANFADIWSSADGFGENISDVNGNGVVDEEDGLKNPLPSVIIPVNNDGVSRWSLKDTNNALPAGFPERNGFNQVARVIAHEAGYVQGKRAIEVITIALADTSDPSSLPIPEKSLRDIARLIGEKGGVFSAAAVTGSVCTSGGIVGVFGGWKFDASNLPGGELCAGTIPPSIGQGGYIAAVGMVFYEDGMKSDVLYKVAIPGRPELNRMEADLDMNGLEIENTRYLTADNIRVTGNLTAPKATTTVDGVLRLQGDRNVITPNLAGVGDDPCQFSDPWSSSATLNPSAVGPCSAKGGYLIVNGYNLFGGVPSIHMENIVIPATNSNLAAQNMTIAWDVVSEEFGSNTVLANTVQTNTLTGTDALLISTNLMKISGNASIGYLSMISDPGSPHTISAFSAKNLDIGTLESDVVDIEEIETNTFTTTGQILVGGKIPNYTVNSMSSCTSTVAYDETGKLVSVEPYDCMP